MNSDDDSESEYNSERDSNENEEDSDEDSVTMDTGLSIEGDEELALKLLNSWENKVLVFYFSFHIIILCPTCSRGGINKLQ